MDEKESDQEPEPGGHMSFLEHLDELRKRLVSSVIILVVAFALCWFFSDRIYNFLSAYRSAGPFTKRPRRDVPIKGLPGDERVTPID